MNDDDDYEDYDDDPPVEDYPGCLQVMVNVLVVALLGAAAITGVILMVAMFLMALVNIFTA